MTESDSDVEFQSADEGEEEEEIKESTQQNTSDQKHDNSPQNQPTDKHEVEEKIMESTKPSDQKHDNSPPNQPTDKHDVEEKIMESTKPSDQKHDSFPPNKPVEEGIQTLDENIEVTEDELNVKIKGEKIDKEALNIDRKKEIDSNLEEDGKRESAPHPSEDSDLKDTTSDKQNTSNEHTPEESPSPCAEVRNIKEDVTEVDNKVCDNSSLPPGEQEIGRQVEANPAGGDSQRANLQSPLDRLSKKSSGGWGWGGWGKSLISSATSTVSGLGHGLSTAIQTVESSLGVPQPEEIALEETNETQLKDIKGEDEIQIDDKNKNKEKDCEEKEDEKKEGEIEINTGEASSSGYSLFSYGASALSGVVGKTVSGGLGALELIGKKTMDVIQDGDPGLRKKREYFTKSNMPSLSQTLKEAAKVAEQAALKEEEDEERNRAHFGILFDKHQGLSHLEALEILSNQSEGKVHSVMATVTGEQLENLKTQMIEIKDAFELQDMDAEEVDYETDTFVDTITEHLFTLSVAATPDKLKRVQRQAHKWLARCKQELQTMKEIKENKKNEILQGNEQDEPINKDLEDKKEDKENKVVNKDATDNADEETKIKEANVQRDNSDDKINTNADKEDDKNHCQSQEKTELNQYLVPKEIHVKAIQTLAELTSRCIEQFHKAAELMLLQQDKEHSKNPIQRAASLSKLTSVLCCEVSSLTSRFCEQLTVAADIMEVKEDNVNPLITNSYLEGSNSMSYIQDAFQLLLPVLQVVAIEYED